MISDTANNPIHKIPSYSNFGFYSVDTTALPLSLANEIMNTIFFVDNSSDDIYPGQYFDLSQNDFLFLEETIKKTTEKNNKLVELFSQYK